MKAFQRLILITVGTLAFFFIVFYGLRQLGLAQSFSTFDHPIMRSHQQLDFSTTTDSESLFLNISLNDQKAWTLAKPKKNTWTNSEFDIQPFLFKDFLESTQSKNILLNIVANTTEQSLKDLDQIIQGHSKRIQIIAMSPFAQIIRKLRTLSPRMLYVAHLSDVMKLEIMSSVYIETLTELKSDFYIYDLEQIRPSLHLLEEIKRQKKKILFVQSKDQEFSSDYKSIKDGTVQIN